jgi:hypothetical protein
MDTDLESGANAALLLESVEIGFYPCLKRLAILLYQDIDQRGGILNRSELQIPLQFRFLLAFVFPLC